MAIAAIRGLYCVCVAMTPQKRGMVDLEAAKRGKVTIQFGELIISSDFDSGTDRLTGGGGWVVKAPNIFEAC